jgi:hypothetical protein
LGRGAFVAGRCDDVVVTGERHQGGSQTVLVAVHPRLLSDALVRALGDLDCHIMMPGVSTAPAQRHFTLAIVNRDLPPGVDADLVIRITDIPEADQDGGIDALPELLERVTHALERTAPDG